MDPVLLKAILAMDSYNRGDDAGIENNTDAVGGRHNSSWNEC